MNLVLFVCGFVGFAFVVRSIRNPRFEMCHFRRGFVVLTTTTIVLHYFDHQSATIPFKRFSRFFNNCEDEGMLVARYSKDEDKVAVIKTNTYVLDLCQASRPAKPIAGTCMELLRNFNSPRIFNMG
ncbi:hypothetical protein HanOQP8_Chr07g0266021 [Helianthus annuus]|nr:hypothetical protein HanHA89_Chr07g0276611 [Helianthus annuus]KAJ0729987.1 hypothetical protein HanLR1_Chr07g0259101 [Helianthus annuus]KAJ0732691.1 hypothetical protein HanOQP8_Chr07g0266021 [Helianthus annuus]KAJ0906346.1 hypothetical protein HanPSC8_Chr07g0304461 [Helianthus annuus]